MQTETFDAIVVGSGISGGWAAKELTEKGLDVLLLERGKNVEHKKDYVNALKLAKAGQTVDVVVDRGGQRVTLQATLEDR